jgi:predicted house-cleaning noncanonical NTP pyrophosphatase (MazG superfamily)
MPIYNKLVRDHIPQIIEQAGKVPKVKILDQASYTEELKLKLLEEANELRTAEEKTEIVEEAADLVEVLYMMLENQGITLEEVEQAREHKKRERGGFKERLFLLEIHD